MTVFEIVDKLVNGDGSTFHPTMIQMAIDEVEQAIKNYCQINLVPDELKFVWSNMAVDLLHYRNASNSNQNNGLDGLNSGEISSLKIGDTTITLGATNTNNEHIRAIKSHRPNLDEIVMNNKQHLNKFRRMVW